MLLETLTDIGFYTSNLYFKTNQYCTNAVLKSYNDRAITVLQQCHTKLEDLYYSAVIRPKIQSIEKYKYILHICCEVVMFAIKHEQGLEYHYRDPPFVLGTDS